jgi:hypothetical protein
MLVPITIAVIVSLLLVCAEFVHFRFSLNVTTGLGIYAICSAFAFAGFARGDLKQILLTFSAFTFLIGMLAVLEGLLRERTPSTLQSGLLALVAIALSPFK